MTVSVLVTAYNEERFLPAAVDSVLAQTRQPEEVLLVDAGSTDDTGAIVDEYAADHGHVEAVHLSPGVTIPEMRNEALERASGDMVTFLDGDDRFRPEKLEQELETYRSTTDAEVVFSNLDYTDEDGTVKQTWCDDEEPPTGDVLFETATRDWPRGNLYRNELVSRELLESLGGFDENLPIFEDWDMKIRLAANTSVAYCPGRLTEYRRHDAGVSARSSHERHRDANKHILDKHGPLFASELSTTERRVVERRLRARIAEHDAFAAKWNGSHTRAVASYAGHLRADPRSILDLRKHARFFLPGPIVEAIRSI
jgi:glycosyltransferase involved in cell wall biosynthesis